MSHWWSLKKRGVPVLEVTPSTSRERRVPPEAHYPEPCAPTTALYTYTENPLDRPPERVELRTSLTPQSSPAPQTPQTYPRYHKSRIELHTTLTPQSSPAPIISTTQPTPEQGKLRASQAPQSSRNLPGPRAARNLPGTSGPKASSRAHPPVRQRTKLVIGIDYGTSHSGVAWALFDPATCISPRMLNITTIRGWSGNRTGDYTAGKVSSELSYDNNGFHWGFDIPSDVPGSKKLKWVKLLLEPEPGPKLRETPTIEESRKQLRKDGRTEIDAASDYITCLWGHAKAAIIKAITQAVFDFADKTIVLTIPAVWSPKAKHNSYLVAVKAGLADTGYSLRIVTEPEAAAVAVLKDKVNTFEAGDCFVVCDAGGGTVDLTSYQIESTEPLCLRERAVGDGGLCGSVFLDIAFKRYLRTLITEEVFDQIAPRHMARMMHEFESCIKRQFSSREDKSYVFDLIGVPYDHKLGNKRESIRLTRDNLMPLFDTVCSDIEALIDKQINTLKKQEISPKALMLVGGFGGNKYLLERLREIYQGDELEIMQPENSLGAVSTGAVLCELLGAGNIVDVHLSRINIGVLCNQNFIEGHHSHEDMYFCKYTQRHKAKSVMWVVKKGDKIRTGEKSIFYFTWIDPVEYSNPDPKKVKVEAHLVRSNVDKASTRKTPDVQNFVSIKFNIDRDVFKNAPQRLNPEGKLFWYIDYEIEMVMGPAKLQFSCIINGAIRDSTSVVYHATNYG